MDKIDHIGQEFVSLAVEHGEAKAIGDHKVANKLHRKLHQCYERAGKLGQPGLFEIFLNANNENVRLWAAVFSLKSSPEAARETLMEIAQSSSSIAGLDAKTTLTLWASGKLELL